MERAGPRDDRQRMELFFVAALVGAVALLVCAFFVVMGLGGFATVLVGKTGPVTNPSDWPEPLTKLCRDFAFTPPAESRIQVHCLRHGMDQEYVWRMDAAPGLFEHVQKRWQLSPVSRPNWRGLKGKSSLSGESVPPWWSPTHGDSTTFYECPATRDREKGHRYCVAFDKGQGVIFVHYWFNF